MDQNQKDFIEATAISSYALQKYLAILLQEDEKKLWPDGILPPTTRDGKSGDVELKLMLDIVPKDHHFDMGSANSQAFREVMSKMINQASIIYQIFVAKMNREVLKDSRLVVDPKNTTIMVYAPNWPGGPEKIRDDQSMRIGFRFLS